MTIAGAAFFAYGAIKIGLCTRNVCMKPVNDEVKKAVIAHIAEYIGINPDQVTLDQDLFRDLGVDGDDATDLIDSYARTFQVDISHFDISRHFGPERPFSLLGVLIRCFSSKKKKVIPLTVRDLIRAEMEHSLVSR